MAKRKPAETQDAARASVPEDPPEPEPESESPSGTDERVKFEWPDAPNGDMLLHDGLGFPGRAFVRFFGGFHITSDAAEIAALRARAAKFRDLYEVPMSVTDRSHAETRKVPPPIPEQEVIRG